MQENPPIINVIIPVLNDSAALALLLEQLCEMDSALEICVSDGGSEDGVEELTDRFTLHLVQSPPGRGNQLNAGAEPCLGDAYWFLHADNTLSSSALRDIAEALADPECVGGAFRFALSEKRWYSGLFHVLIHLRSKWLGLPYGDQGFFVRREVFERIGGFKTIPILEDVDFVRRVKREGKFTLLATPIGISPRRWDDEGVVKRTLLNWYLMARYFLGASPETLARFHQPRE